MHQPTALSLADILPGAIKHRLKVDKRIQQYTYCKFFNKEVMYIEKIDFKG